jgi:arylsulfatase A-like enzyme
MCENIDWKAGRVLEKLNQLRLKENTIVVYMSDNGPNSFRWNGRKKGGKGPTDEGGVRSPLFLSWPAKIKAGTQITQLAAAIDLLPTLADLTGIEYDLPKVPDGVSLRPLLFDERGEWKDRFIFSHWNGRVSVRTEQYRLDHEGKLFDMKNDPGQLSDVTTSRPAEANRTKGRGGRCA